MEIGEVVYIGGYGTGIRDGYYEIIAPNFNHFSGREHYFVKARVLKYKDPPFLRECKKSKVYQHSLSVNWMQKLNEDHIKPFEDMVKIIKGLNEGK